MAAFSAGKLLARLTCAVALCWVFLLAEAKAQDAEALAKLLAKAPPDTHRVTLLTDYAWEISETAPDEAEERIREAIRLAQQLGFKHGEAKAWNGLGLVEEARGNYEKAIAHYEKALKIRHALGDRRGKARALTNLGNAYDALGKPSEALARHRESLALSEALRDTQRIARALSNISTILATGGAYPEAFSELNKARLLLENSRDSASLFQLYTKIGHNRMAIDIFDDAEKWYKKSLDLRQAHGDSLDIADGLMDWANALDEYGSSAKDKSRSGQAVELYRQALAIYQAFNNQHGIAAACNNLADALKHLDRNEEALSYLRRSEQIRQQLGDRPGLMETYNTLNDVLSRLGKPLESLKYIRLYEAIALEIGDKNASLGALKDYARAYAQLSDYKRAFEFATRYNDERFKALGESRARGIETQIALTTAKEKEIALEREKNIAALREAELAKARTFRNALLGGALLLALLAALLFNRNRIRARANRLLAAKNQAIEMERQRADQLLKNILPEKTAEELKAEGVVKPTHYASVTVLFTDFKNFTTIAENLSPDDLVRELDEHFRLFDDIVAQHGLEKIKTIGDAYMCAGGLPEPNETHALDTVRAAIQMQAAIRRLAAQKAAEGKPYFEMRVGIHTGPVVAGVVGSRKFAYDIWGDTVNTAARLEQGGEPGRINLSESTWLLVRDEVPCAYRGRLPAKNKGEIAMYFVEEATPSAVSVEEKDEAQV